MIRLEVELNEIRTIYCFTSVFSYKNHE